MRYFLSRVVYYFSGILLISMRGKFFEINFTKISNKFIDQVDDDINFLVVMCLTIRNEISINFENFKR